MLVPIEIDGKRKWINIKIKAIEQKWFDDFSEFYTYVIKHITVTEVIDEEKLIEDIREYLSTVKHENCTLEDLINEIMIQHSVSRENATGLLKKTIKFEIETKINSFIPPAPK